MKEKHVNFQIGAEKKRLDQRVATAIANLLIKVNHLEVL